MKKARKRRTGHVAETESEETAAEPEAAEPEAAADEPESEG